MLGKSNTCSRKSTSDRFIPSRIGSDTFSFFVAHGNTSKPQPASSQNGIETSNASLDSDSFDPLSNASAASTGNMREEYSASLYTNLLQAHFMGSTSMHNAPKSYSAVATYSAEEDHFSANSNNLNQLRIAPPPLKKLFSYGESSYHSSNYSGINSAGNGIINGSAAASA